MGSGGFQNRNKENEIKDNGPSHRRYRSGSRARYQKSMQGSGIADLMNFEAKKPDLEIKVGFLVCLGCILDIF